MQHAKRMVLVDEQILESLKSRSWEKPMQHLIHKQETKQQLSWRKPIDIRSKTEVHLKMKSIADNPTFTDDVKAKTYGQLLAQFRRINSSKSEPLSPDTDDVENNEAEENNLIVDNTAPKKVKPKKTKKRQASTPYSPVMRSTRAYKRKAIKTVSDLDFET